MSDPFNHAVFAWLVAAAVFGIFEISTRLFAFIFCAAAALVTALAARYFPLWEVQMAIFAVLSILGLFVLRPQWVTRIQSKSKGVPSRSESLVGKLGLITDAIDPIKGSGRILVEGQDWAARAQEFIPSGARAVVQGADGVVLQVKKSD